MKVKAVLSAFLFLILLMPRLAAAEDARLPYHEIYSMEKVQLDLSRTYTNLALVLQMHSTQTNVTGGEIKATINSKSGPGLCHLGRISRRGLYRADAR